MEKNIDRAVIRVLRKLSAMRATFNEQDQQILDVLLMRDAAEVEGHVKRFMFGDEARLPEPDEVEAHARRVGMEAGVRLSEPDEVEAHARRAGMEPEVRLLGPAEGRVAYRTVHFDSASGEYRIR